MRCPITYQPTDSRYSAEGLKRINRSLVTLHDLPFTAGELRTEAAARAEKMSIQGVQPKLSAQLSPKHGEMQIVDTGGHYILKPQSVDFPELPENEDLTMRLASSCGIDVPLHFLMYGKDNKLTYVIKRFDRKGKGGKESVEDFAQLSGASRSTKYRSSMEQVAKVIETYCTFPVVEFEKLFRIVLFCFLTGNEDMHLKNFSITYDGKKTSLTPAYDLLNTTIAIPNPVEELALPLHARKNKLTRSDFIDYYAIERLRLQPKVIDRTLEGILKASEEWEGMIRNSFLTPKMQDAYIALLQERKERVF